MQYMLMLLCKCLLLCENTLIRMYAGINFVKKGWLNTFVLTVKCFIGECPLVVRFSAIFHMHTHMNFYYKNKCRQLDKMNQSNICMVENLLHKEDILI